MQGSYAIGNRTSIRIVDLKDPVSSRELKSSLVPRKLLGNQGYAKMVFIKMIFARFLIPLIPHNVLVLGAPLSEVLQRVSFFSHSNRCMTLNLL